jgi:hypothetical protein
MIIRHWAVVPELNFCLTTGWENLGLDVNC